MQLAHELRRSSGSLGAAFFDPVTCLIRVVEDTLETSHFDTTNMGESVDSRPENDGALTCASPRIGGSRADSDHEEDG